jgi:hypothetical protein
MAGATSDTFLFGEWDGKGPPDAGWQPVTPAWMTAGFMPLAWVATPPPSGQDPNWWTLGSRHTGVMMFTLGDGSVRPVRYPGSSGQSFNSYLYAGGASDGRVYRANDL